MRFIARIAELMDENLIPPVELNPQRVTSGSGYDDLCPFVDHGCIGAREMSQFEKQCSRNYEGCSIYRVKENKGAER